MAAPRERRDPATGKIVVLVYPPAEQSGPPLPHGHCMICEECLACGGPDELRALINRVHDSEHDIMIVCEQCDRRAENVCNAVNHLLDGMIQQMRMASKAQEN